MRKTTAYARKQRRQGATYNGAEAFNTIQRCRAYTDEPVIGMKVEGTQTAATKAMLLVREAFIAIKHGTATNDGLDFDVIAHALGVAWLRAVEIAGYEATSNPMLCVIQDANEAMRRTRDRFERLTRWGFDGPAIDEVGAGIELYETILQSSSPAQMTAAADQRAAILKAQKAH
jgi:hypothetical protein